MLLFTALSLSAHDLIVEVQTVEPIVVVRATYAGTEAVAYAKVQVRSPQNVDFQKGTTDIEGRFGFAPDGNGDWRISVDDEMGHKTNIVVKVGEPRPPPVEIPRWVKAIGGLAVMGALTAALHRYRAVKSSQIRP